MPDMLLPGLAQEIPDLATANAFVSGSFDKYTQCIVNYELLQTVSGTVTEFTSPATSTIMSTAASLPAQVLSTTMLLVGVALLVWGFRLLRPVNLLAGAYLGGTVALLMLNIFAGGLDSCPAIVSIATASGLLLGVLCALKRSSVLVVLGLVAGEIVGDLFYKTFLAAVSPEYVAFGCIGFFAVLLGVLAGHMGDLAFEAGSAFFGAYLVVSNALRLAMPFVPNGVEFEGFLAFRPDVTQSIARAAEYQDTVFGSAYVYGPVLILLILTVGGTLLQIRLLKASQKDLL